MEEIRAFLNVGDGSGNGSGYGSGDGSGSGYGSGDGDGLIAINGQKIYDIDSIPTIITKIKGNIAKGEVLSSDLTRSKCYIIKHNNLFAHGETLKIAKAALEEKLLQKKSIRQWIFSHGTTNL